MPTRKQAEAARDTIKSFRDYIEQHKAEIEALQILYSRPFKKRLTEESLRELEAKLKPEFGPQPVPDYLACLRKDCNRGSPSALVKNKSQTRRFTDLSLACPHSHRTYNSARTIRRTREEPFRRMASREGCFRLSTINKSGAARTTLNRHRALA